MEERPEDEQGCRRTEPDRADLDLNPIDLEPHALGQGATELGFHITQPGRPSGVGHMQTKPVVFIGRDLNLGSGGLGQSL